MHRRGPARGRGVLAGLTLLALVLAGCSSGDDDEEAAPTTTTTTTAAPALGPGSTYVALGSSIASGFGISVQSTSCGRSDRSYPNLLARRLELELVDVTCGAAQIRHVADEAQGENPPQLEALTPDAALVTLTVGGNDIAYNATALSCGDPATECTLPATFDADLEKMRTDLAELLERIAELAPDATVVFVTYPREAPAEGNCEAMSFTDAEVEVVRTMGEELQQVFLDLAEQTGVLLADPYSEPGDHTGCAPPEERWADGNVAEDGFAYHPTALGHEVMADLVEDVLSRGTPARG